MAVDKLIHYCKFYQFVSTFNLYLCFQARVRLLLSKRWRCRDAYILPCPMPVGVRSQGKPSLTFWFLWERTFIRGRKTEKFLGIVDHINNVKTTACYFVTVTQHCCAVRKWILGSMCPLCWFNSAPSQNLRNRLLSFDTLLRISSAIVDSR